MTKKKIKSNADDGKHTTICGLAHMGLSIFGYVGGFGDINWKEICPPNTIWVESPNVKMGVKECECDGEC